MLRGIEFKELHSSILFRLHPYGACLHHYQKNFIQKLKETNCTSFLPKLNLSFKYVLLNVTIKIRYINWVWYNFMIFRIDNIKILNNDSVRKTWF